LEVENAEKTKYMFTFCEQNAGQNHNMKTANKSLRGKTEIFGYRYFRTFLHVVRRLDSIASYLPTALLAG
jgi:hypothetical protein